MDDNSIQFYIADHADTIKKKMDGGRIYGKLIDMSNLDDVVVAAYFIGFLDAQKMFGNHDLDF